jgi:exodeoxyribonuclease V gamma subunit
MESVNPIAQAASALCVGGTMPPRWVSIQLDDATVSGELTELYQAGRVVHQYSRVKAKNLLQLWVAHLALCAAPELPVCKYSWLVGRPPRGTGLEQQRLRPVQNPERILGELVRLFQLGQTGPLRLFPEASLALARGLLDPKQERSKALYSANLAYKTELRYGSALLQVYGDSERLHWYGPENSDPEHHPNFEELSEQVFVPLLEHMEDLP